ncbi:hypothetical protein PFLG_00521 [Plasmodium falciparum RAJ116]|uniref:Uncharacterized protein n=1 Tax=Plasmodium falciparum RAJ116 TaxID=580058 RepID=A0A0L0CT55_PLAFA|nr:hypothetical protein PFLG_00521 [Plasmodium falciparum RAJ116]
MLIYLLTNVISPNLVIIFHSLVKSNVIHIEFFYICLQYFNKYFIHLNNIDICNILYSFSRCQLAIKSNHTINKLCMRKRIMDNCFQNFVNNIIKKLNIYNEYYSMDQINNMENMYNAYYDYFHKLKNNLLSLSSPTNFFLCINNDGKLDKLKCWNVLNKIINHIEKNEKVLNNFTSLQISSIILSICKLKINSLNIFYALNYRVHYLWKYFSLHSIADYLYVINERNIYDEQISFLLFYQFVKIIMWKYLQYMENKLCIASINNGIHKNKIKQNNQGIIYHLLLNGQNDHNNHNKDNNNNNAILKKKRKKKLHLLNDSDISMCIRIFQSFSKFDIIKNINMFLYYYHIYFPYDISTICIKYDKLLNKKKILMRDTLEHGYGDQTITLDRKCLLCDFMLSVPHFLYPVKLYNKNNLLGNICDIKYMNKDTNNNHIDNNIYPFKLYFKKKWKRFNIYIPPSAYMLLGIGTTCNLINSTK